MTNLKIRTCKNKTHHLIRNRLMVPAALLIIILAVLVFLKPAFIGYFVFEGAEEHVKEVDRLFAEDSTYTFIPETEGELKSLKIDGWFIGDGSARVYLEADNESYLVFDSNAPEEGGLAGITGFAVKDKNKKQDKKTNETIISNNQPILVKDIPDLVINENKKLTLNLNNYFSDEDKDALAYSCTDIENISVLIKKNIVKLTPDEGFVGNKTIRFIASDLIDSAESNEVTVSVVKSKDNKTDKINETPDPDSSPPNPIASLQVVSKTGVVVLSWTNPDDADFAGVKALRKQDVYPALDYSMAIADSLVVDITDKINSPAALSDDAVTAGITYYYRVYSYDSSLNYAPGRGVLATAEGVESDETENESIELNETIPANETIDLNETIPTSTNETIPSDETIPANETAFVNETISTSTNETIPSNETIPANETAPSNETIENLTNPPENAEILIELEYNDGTEFDSDNDGIEARNGIIDFNANAGFNWNADESNLCTRWETYSIDNESSVKVCYGNERCCNFIGLEPLTPSWNEVFYSYYSRYGAGSSNRISSQVAYVDYSLDEDDLYSYVYYSDWASLNAVFLEEEEKITYFDDICMETCLLSLDETSYRLRIELENATLRLGNISYTIIPLKAEIINNAPELLMDIPEITISKNRELLIDLSEYFSDKDNDSLEYTIYEMEDIPVFVDGSIVTLIPKKGFTGIRHAFITANDSKQIAVSNVFVVNVTKEELPEEIAVKNITEMPVQLKAEINKPVKWVKKIKAENNKSTAKSINVSFSLQKQAFNISVKDTKSDKYIDEDKIAVKPDKKVPEKAKIKEKELEFEDSFEANKTKEYIAEYETEAPVVTETDISPYEKQIIISSDVHYEDILAYTSVRESRRELIKLYWLVNDSRELVSDVGYKDTNNNGLIDRLEWIVSSLSDQTYEIIIEISKAEHLDENYSFISDIYDEVYQLDDVWSEPVYNNEYVRVVFERELTSSNDITVYARNTQQLNTIIEVYHFNSTEKITEFPVITDEKYYKVYLTDMSGSHDTFDLKIKNLDNNEKAYLEFDHIIDPTGWLTGWDNRIKLTIDNTKIDSALTWFPVTVFLNSTQGEEVFTEFDSDSDYLKVAFTKSDGTTELYAEKELFSLPDGGGTYTSQYPPAHSDTYVKSTTKYDTNYWAYYATDPAKSLTGTEEANCWTSGSGVTTNQRFHIDLGSGKIIRRIYYENWHSSGDYTNRSAQNFTFWGSNTAGSFADLNYTNNTGWTQLTTNQSTFDEHVAADQADPKYITVTNSIAYRYYAFKFADNYGGALIGIRRVELQTEESKAIYHVSRDGWAISNTSDTDFYMYYDNDHANNTAYIGAINTTAGGNVWDGNFKAVYHMVDGANTSHIYDSTSNDNDGTKNATNKPVEATGKVGKGQDFDGTEDYITIPAITLDNFTIEMWVEPDNLTGSRTILSNNVVSYPYVLVRFSGTNIYLSLKDNEGDALDMPVASGCSIDTFYYITAIVTGTTAKIYVDTVEKGTDTNVDFGSLSLITDFYIGTDIRDGGIFFFDGVEDEVRISNTDRSLAWNKASYNSGKDTLLTYGSEETVPPTIIANVTSPSVVCSNTDFKLNLTITDPDDGETLTAYTQFYVNDIANGSELSLVVINNTNTNVANLSSSNFNGGATLIAEFWAGDGTLNTTKENTTTKTVYWQMKGTVKDSDSVAVNNSKVIIINQTSNAILGTTTSNSTGGWTYAVLSGTYLVIAYDPNNSTRDADADPHIVVS